jgi:hypothetical protein
MAQKKRKPAAKRKPDKKALVFQLGEIPSLPDFVRVCREIAKCPARHRPVEDYLRWTFMIVHDRWTDELELPPHDPALHKEADGDYIPGFAWGLYDLLEALPGFSDVVPPTKGEALYYVEDHVELSVAEVAEHLRGRGFEIVSAAQLLATHEPGTYDSEPHIAAWLEEERAAFEHEMAPEDLATLAFIRGDVPQLPRAPVSAGLLQRCLMLNHRPSDWNAFDRRIARVLVENGAAERLLQGLTTNTWEAPEEAWRDLVAELVSFGMPAEAARGLVMRHVVHDENLGLSDALWLLVHRAELRTRFADDHRERAEVERAIRRALSLARSSFSLKFPRDV